MVFQDNCFKFFYCLTYSVRLTQNIDAVFVLFNHFTDASKVTVDVVKSFEYVLLFSTHTYSSSYFTHTHRVWRNSITVTGPDASKFIDLLGLLICCLFTWPYSQASLFLENVYGFQMS